MQLHLLKIFSIVRRDEEVFVLILPCNCNESSHLHPGTQFIAVGQGPKFHTTLQQQCESKLKSLRLDLKSQFSIAALSADCTSADFEAPAGNYEVAYNPQPV